MTTTSHKKWFEELAMELRLREVTGAAIGDAVASARELLEDTGETPQEAFGSARDYAAALELPRTPASGAVMSVLWTSVVSLLALLLFVQASTAWAEGDLLLLSPVQLALLSVPVLVSVFLPLYLPAIMRNRWLLVALVTVCTASGLLSSLVAPSTSAGAWLAIDPMPWLIGSAAIMVLLSIWSTVEMFRRGEMDDTITVPLEAPSSGSKRRAMAFAVLINWLFPCIAALILATSHLLAQ
jgi:hypothetical protein